MGTESTSNKRLVKNTFILYIRMAVVLVISLYTSRLVLIALGISDFGLFGVIGGVIGLFAFLQSSLSKATQRFINVEMVKENGLLKEVFRTSWTVHLIIVLIIVVLVETIGLWFLNAKINIPEGREFAANIIFQTTVFSLCLSVLQTPFSACVIAHEDMPFFAVVSVIEAFLKLGIAYLIINTESDRLILYGLLLLGVSFINTIAYLWYCFHKYSETSIRPLYNKEMFMNISNYVGWTLVGQVAIVICTQGTSVLVNMFHSVIANAALTVGNQVSNAVTNLTSNFQMAFNPQITKSYAEGKYFELKNLVFMTSKISFCLLFVVALPICMNITFILHIWLEEVPINADIFCVLLLVNNIINALSAPLNFSVLATGRIKWFQIVTSLFYMLDIVIVYFLFLIGLPAATALWVKVVVMFLILIIRLYYAHREIPDLGLIAYLKEVLFPIIFISVICSLLGLFVTNYFSNFAFRLLLTMAVFIASIIMIWFIALDNNQRKTIIYLIKTKYVKHM